MANAEDARPEPIDLSHHLTAITRNREASNIKQFYKYFLIPNIKNVGGGTPNFHLFPYHTLQARVASPFQFQPTPNKPIGANPQNDCEERPITQRASSGTLNITVPREASTDDKAREIDVKTALQYGTAQGYPPLSTFVREFAREVLHPNVPYKDGPETILTCGNTDGLAKSVEALATPWIEGENSTSIRQGVLCEEYAYGLALQALKPRGLNIVPVRVDAEGMVADGPGGLEEVLEDWNPAYGQRPHLMYTVTVGQNPSTGTLSVSRRRKIYTLCVKHDIVIIEDDPYWFLQYPSAYEHAKKNLELLAEDGIPGARNYNAPRSSGYAFLDSLVPSYLSIDYQGRVVRLDTFSKIIAPGCRLGWITAQPRLIERLLRITEASTQQPSGFVQSMVARLILGAEGTLSTPKEPHHSTASQESPPWKMDGWVRWLEGLRGAYERRMNHMCEVLEDGQWHVKSGRRPSLDQNPALSSALRPNEPGHAHSGDADDSWAVIAKTQMFSFAWPRGGMFVWLRVHVESHPLADKVAAPTLIAALWEFLTTPAYRVLVSPGDFFGATPEVAEQRAYRYFRLCFAAIDDSEVERAAQAFVRGCRDFWRKKNPDDVEALALAAEARDSDLTSPNESPMISLVGGC